MPQLKTADADPKQRILQVAAEVFAAEGHAGARVDEIARRAGVNKAMLYYHVGDKDALYASIFGATLAEARRRLEEGVAAATGPENRFRAFVLAAARMATEHPHFAPLMLREIASGGSALPDPIIVQMRGVFGVLAEIIGEGVSAKIFRPVDPAMTHMFIGGSLLVLISGAPIRRRIRGSAAVPERPEDVAAYVADLLLNGLRKPTAKKKKTK